MSSIDDRAACSPLRPSSLINDTRNDIPSHVEEAVSVKQCLERAAGFSFKHMHGDYHWCGELFTNVTNTAEYVMLYQALGQPLEKDALRQWFLTQQNPDGSFGFGYGEPGNLSATIEAYFALKILGQDAKHPLMLKARDYACSQGGIAVSRNFTKIYLATFGLLPYEALPQMPPEAILVPYWFPLNVYKLSSWARCVTIPLLVLLHNRPIYPLPNGTTSDNDYLDELWLDPSHKTVPYMETLASIRVKHGIGWRFFFGVVDTVCTKLGGLRWSPTRGMALRQCEEWILAHQETSGDWGGYCPPITNAMFALSSSGFSLDSEPIRRGFMAYEAFGWKDERGKRIQASCSPVWDTALMLTGLCEAGVPISDERMEGASAWLMKRQILEERGDWSIYRPDTPSGGFAFEYNNALYPDTDDTAAVILGMIRQNADIASSQCVNLAVEWLLGMQCHDGGWASFDADNDQLCLNEIPFADIDALCDPPTADVTSRIMELLGELVEMSERVPGVLPGDLFRRVQHASRRGVDFLLALQEDHGGWWGRWGVNYIYGTSHVLCALSHHENVPQEAIRQGCAWLQSVQQADGGWGEHLRTYNDPKLAGQGTTTASQTAWAIMGLLTYLPPDHYAIVKGVEWLVAHQGEDGTWPEPEHTAVGFPRHLFMRYDLYRHYFPLTALGRYARKTGMVRASDLTNV